MLKNIFIFFIVLSINYGISAQNQQVIDSLLKVTKSDISKQKRVDAYISLSVAYRSSDSSKTYQYSKKAIQLAEEIKYHEGKINALYQIGVLNYFTGSYKKANSIFHQIIQEADKYQYPRGKAKAYNGVGIVYRTQGNYEKALKYCFKSLKIAKKLRDEEMMAHIYNNLGIIYENQGNYEKALSSYFQSLNIYKKVGNKKGKNYSYNNIGIIYENQGNYEKALDFYHKTLKIRKELKDKQGMGVSYNNIGIIYENQGNYEKALDFYFKALRIRKELGDKKGIATTNNNIGDTYLALGSFDKALKYNLKALEIAKTVGVNKITSTISISIAEVYQKQKQWKSAQKYLNNALQVAQDIGLIENIKNSAELLAQIEKELGNHQKAYEYHVLFKQMSDSLFNEDQTKKLTSLELNYEFEQERNAIKLANKAKQDILKKDIENRKNIQIATFIGLGLSLALVIVLVFFFRTQKRSNQKLNQANEEIQVTLDIVESQRDEILSSIQYAQRIQASIFPRTEYFQELFPKHFIFFKPRDMVSGDFYWAFKTEAKPIYEEMETFEGKHKVLQGFDSEKIILTAVDCTGHGVPGAFMSMVGNDLLNVIVKDKHIYQADKILTHLHKDVRQVLQQKETNTNDGMDMALVVIDKEKKVLDFAGAKNPLIYIQNNKLKVIKGNKMSIGGEQREEERVFTSHQIDISEPTTFYLFSDGFQDQFGGEKGKKFMVRHFRELLFEIHEKPMEEQKSILKETLANWMGKEEQVDDILVLGVKV